LRQTWSSHSEAQIDSLLPRLLYFPHTFCCWRIHIKSRLQVNSFILRIFMKPAWNLSEGQCDLLQDMWSFSYFENKTPDNSFMTEESMFVFSGTVVTPPTTFSYPHFKRFHKSQMRLRYMTRTRWKVINIFPAAVRYNYLCVVTIQAKDGKARNRGSNARTGATEINRTPFPVLLFRPKQGVVKQNKWKQSCSTTRHGEAWGWEGV
jgi:hypothetical protein